MNSKLARKAIGALVSASFMVSMIPAMASAKVINDHAEIDFAFSTSEPVKSGDSVTFEGITLTVGGDEDSQVSGTSNRFFGVAADGTGTYTFSIDQNGEFAGGKITAIDISVGANVVGCEVSDIEANEDWSTLTANSIFSWESEPAEKVSLTLDATAGSGHYFNYSAITVFVEFPAAEEIHRLYNPNSGEHFYTADDAEAENLINLGWNDEDIGWIAPIVSDTPVYRLYNPNAGEHHYTTDESEVDNLVNLGWTFEDIAWYSAPSDDAFPIYRQYNPNEFANNHNYTGDVNERDNLISLGWIDEDIAWYGYSPFLVAGEMD